MHPDVERVLHLQDGVISRRQTLDAGMQRHEIRKMLRRNEWARVHPGVYVNHTGPTSWPQRAWAVVLYAEPAALCVQSALCEDGTPIHVAVSRSRAMLVEPPGVRIHHMSGLDERVLWNVGPSRMRYEEAALDVAATATSDTDAIAVLANACQSRHTTAPRLLRTLDGRTRIRRRRWLRAVLVDVADGTCSVLEHGYLNRVERAHGLPRATRQKRSTSSLAICYRDAEYGQRLVVELDGRSTVRLCYRQVFDRPCRTAAKIAQLMQRHGIKVNGRGCGPGCEFTRLDVAA